MKRRAFCPTPITTTTAAAANNNNNNYNYYYYVQFFQNSVQFINMKLRNCNVVKLQQCIIIQTRF